MDEVRRFLRYTLPGLSAVIQLLIALSITDVGIVCKILSVKDLTQSLGLVLTIFIGSGGLGYLFANIYFSLYWSWPFNRSVAIDHLSFLNNLKKEVIEIIDSSGKPYEKDLSRREAWTIITQYWHSKIEKDPKIKGVNSITDRLTDVTHGLGATYVGSLSALASWIGIHLAIAQNSASFSHKEIFILVSWIILIVLLSFAYRRANMALQSIANSTLTDIIRCEYQLTGKKVNIYYEK